MHSLEHALKDSFKILPFLLLTYLVMEFLEEQTGEKTNLWFQKAGKWGPVLGGCLGIIPQCGISAVASNLYAGRIISVGTLIAVFLSASDEMVPVMIANGSHLSVIAKIVIIKMVIAIIVGFIIDYTVKVTSYVKCTADFIAPDPTDHIKACTPSPRCESLSGTERNKPQAGPNEEFDSCIEKCDGGKYTEKCSLKCYEKVYGKTNKKLAVDYSNGCF